MTVRQRTLWILNAPAHSRRPVAGHVPVHRLQSDPTGTGEAIQDEIAAPTEHSGPESIDLWIHPDTFIAEDPTSRLHIDLLTGGENFFKDVSVAVQPHHALRLCRGEPVHEEPGRTEQHVSDPLLAGVSILQIACGRQVLVLANLDRSAGPQMQRKDVAGAVARKRDLARPTRLGHQQLHACDHPLERTLALEPDIEPRVLP